MPTNKSKDDSMRNKDKSTQQQQQDSHKHLRDKDDRMQKDHKSSPGASSDDQNKSDYNKNR